MKKELIYSFALVLIASLIVFPLVAAQNAENVLQQAQDAKDKVDSTVNKLKDTPENIRNKYLTTQWNEMIAKNRILGPFHTFFSKNQWFFGIVFNHPYELTITFICIFFFWLFITIFISNTIGASDLFGNLAGAGLAIFSSIILAQLGVINFIVSKSLALIMSNELWWMRLILSLLIIAAIFFVGYIGQGAGKIIKNYRENKEKAHQRQIIKETESLLKGVDKGRKIADEINAKFPKSEGWERVGVSRYRKTYK